MEPMKPKTTEYGIITYLKEKLQSITSFDFSTITWIEIGYSVGAAIGGFLSGMIIKKHGKTLFMFLSLSGILIATLTYFGIATVHFEKAKQLVGLPEQIGFYGACELGLLYIKAHALISGALALGFLIGYLFG